MWPSNERSRSPLALSHSLTVLSADALASIAPSGENFTATTPRVCPRSVLYSLLRQERRFVLGERTGSRGADQLIDFVSHRLCHSRCSGACSNFASAGVAMNHSMNDRYSSVPMHACRAPTCNATCIRQPAALLHAVPPQAQAQMQVGQQEALHWAGQQEAARSAEAAAAPRRGPPEECR